MNTVINNNYKIYSQTQGKVLSRSFLITGIGFLSIALIGYAFGILFNKLIYEWSHPEIVNLLWFISLILIFVSMFASMFIMRDIFNQATWKVVMMLCFYCAVQGMAFGMLFTLFGQDTYSLVLLFGVSGLIFLLCSLIGYFLTIKATFSLMKLISYAWMGMFFIMLIIFIPMLLMIFMPDFSIWGFQWFYWLIMGLMGFLFMAYITYDVSVIAKSAQFVSLTDNQAQNNIILVYGYRLLVDLIGMIWIVASFMLAFGRR